MIRIVLDKARFRDLVAGRVVVCGREPRVELILSDIGWIEMLRAVLDSMGVPSNGAENDHPG